MNKIKTFEQFTNEGIVGNVGNAVKKAVSNVLSSFVDIKKVKDMANKMSADKNIQQKVKQYLDNNKDVCNKLTDFVKTKFPGGDPLKSDISQLKTNPEINNVSEGFAKDRLIKILMNVPLFATLGGAASELISLVSQYGYSLGFEAGTPAPKEFVIACALAACALVYNMLVKPMISQNVIK